MQEHKFATHIKSEVIYVYRNGAYRPGGEAVIKREVEVKLGELATVHRVNEVIGHVLRSTYIEPEKFEAPVNLINLANGILNIDTGELKPHTPDVVFLNQLPVRYDPNATCPAIEKFLGEVLHHDDIPLAYEVIGYCLYRSYLLAKAVALLGDGENGKSTLLKMIEAFLGRESCSNVSLQDLETNRFAAAQLFGKLANIHADLSDRALQTTGRFKMLTGRDTISAEFKFKSMFNFDSYAKLLFSANRLPETKDESTAFFRRWILINFPNRFPPDKADPKKLEKITLPAELSGLLNMALKGLKRLLERWQFSCSKTAEEIKVDYVHKSNPVWAFFVDCLEVDPDGEVAKGEVYNAYVNYCNERKLPTVREESFAKGLMRRVSLTTTRPLVDGKRVQSWKGIRFK